jgi:phospholipid/cholesterol/gamma-HCH transport system ATP-binding protein
MTDAISPTPHDAAAEAPVCLPDSPLCFQNVSLSFGPRTLLDSISFTLRPGETRILLGLAGMGKSTLLKLANGLIQPDSGEIFLFGQPIATMPESALLNLRRRTGMVFQESALFDSLTVRDNVAWQLIERRIADDEINRRVHRALSFVELDEAFALFPPSLSGGMRRRVSIARAIIDKPDLILYDSPTGGLDPVTSHTINELVVKERDVYKTPAILVTHRLQDAFTMVTHRFDRETNAMVPLPSGSFDPLTSFLVLHESHLIFDGTTDELLSSQDPFLRDFLA